MIRALAEDRQQMREIVMSLLAAHQAPQPQPIVNVTIPNGAIQAHVTVEPTELRIEQGAFAVNVEQRPADTHVSNIVPFPHAAEVPQLEVAMPFRLLEESPDGPEGQGRQESEAEEIADETTVSAA